MGDERLVTPGLRRVAATRFVLPLREGGSVPGLFEADDDGLYVVKFHGAAQGPKTLTAELIAGEIGRALGLKVPELVLVDLAKELTIGEPDPEIQDHLQRSVGLNLGLDFLPGALPYDAAAQIPVDPVLAADIVWFDAYIANVDRTTRNPNMLRWHGDLWLIDNGAAIYPHHRWTDPAEQGRRHFAAIKDHVLLPVAGSLVEADARLAIAAGRDRAVGHRRQRAGRVAARGRGFRSAGAPARAVHGLLHLPPAGPAPVHRGGRASAHRRGRRRDRPAPRDARPPPWVTPKPATYTYAVLRLVPRVERGEGFNVGVALLCRPKRFLGARTALDMAKFAVMAPGVDADLVRAQLAAIERVAAGEPDRRPDGGAGPLRALPLDRVAEQHHHPARADPHRPHYGPGRDPGAPLPRACIAGLVDFPV